MAASEKSLRANDRNGEEGRVSGIGRDRRLAPRAPYRPLAPSTPPPTWFPYTAHCSCRSRANLTKISQPPISSINGAPQRRVPANLSRRKNTAAGENGLARRRGPVWGAGRQAPLPAKSGHWILDNSRVFSVWCVALTRQGF